MLFNIHVDFILLKRITQMFKKLSSTASGNIHMLIMLKKPQCDKTLKLCFSLSVFDVSHSFVYRAQCAFAWLLHNFFSEKFMYQFLKTDLSIIACINI